MKKAASSAAFSLVEVVLALGVASFCLIVLLGLLPTGLSVQGASSRETAAVNIASGLIEDLQAGPATATVRYGLAVPASGAGQQQVLFLDDSGTATNAAHAAYAAVVTLLGSPAQTTAHVLVTWPAGANASISTNSAYTPSSDAGADLRSQLRKTLGSVEFVAVLNRP